MCRDVDMSFNIATDDQEPISCKSRTSGYMYPANFDLYIFSIAK